MTIDGKDAERIAKDLIRQIASDWTDTSMRCFEVDGAYIFEFILLPGAIVRYAHYVDRPVAVSILRFDPLAEATEIVIGCASMLDKRRTSNPRMADLTIRNSAKPRIRQMLISAPDVFRDAMWQARIVGETVYSVEVMRPLGRPDIARGLIKSAIAKFDKKLRDRFGKITLKQKPKITQIKLNTAIRGFLPEYKATGRTPSRRKFAAALGVSPKGWRLYLGRNELGEHESIIKEWLEDLRSRER